MAISKQYTHYGLLNRWAEILNVEAMHFNQAAGAGAPFVNDACREVWIQFEREHVARALGNAGNKMKTALGFSPSPVFESEIIPLGRGTPYQFQHLQTKTGKLIEFGQRATSLISAGVAVVYSDADGDTVNDTATITVATGVSDAEIALFFQVADGAPGAADVRYEITPVTVTSAGGVVTITAPRAYFVKPSEWNKPYNITDPNKREKNTIDTATTAGFVTAVDVYRVYTDTTTPLQVVSDPIYTQNVDLDLNLATTGVARIVNADLGLFEARVENCTGCIGPIESVRVFYKAGYALEFGHMEGQLEEACIRLANTLMPEQPTTLCQPTWEMWAADRQSMKVDNMVLLQEKDTGSPFGLKQGQVSAWHVVNDYRIRRGGKITYGIR